MRQRDQFDLHLGQRALEGGVHHIAGLKVFLTGCPVAHANHHPAIEKVMDTHLRGGRVSVIEAPRRNLTGAPELQTLRQRLVRPPARSTARW